MSIGTIRNPYALSDLWDGREIGETLTLRRDRRWTLTTGDTGVLPENVATDALMTVKVLLLGESLLLHTLIHTIGMLRIHFEALPHKLRFV